MKCKGCKYFIDGKWQPKCRRYPRTTGFLGFFDRFADAYEDEWCGEYKKW